MNAGTCPNCDRYIGPVLECPYCGCDPARNPFLKSLRWISVLLAVSGLTCLLFMNTAGKQRPTRIDKITPMMNFAYVRTSGTVERPPYVSRNKGTVEYLSFLLNDGSGKLRVAAYDQVAAELEARGLVPDQHNTVNVSGTLNISGNRNIKLIIRSADDVRIRRSGVSRLRSEATASQGGQIHLPL